MCHNGLRPVYSIHHLPYLYRSIPIATQCHSPFFPHGHGIHSKTRNRLACADCQTRNSRFSHVRYQERSAGMGQDSRTRDFRGGRPYHFTQRFLRYVQVFRRGFDKHGGVFGGGHSFSASARIASQTVIRGSLFFRKSPLCKSASLAISAALSIPALYAARKKRSICSCVTGTVV